MKLSNLMAWKFPKAVFAVLILSLLMTGCVSRLSYQFIDIWLAWSVDDYVTLDDVQEALLDQRVDALVEWHRKTQLPRYIEWMQGIRERVKQPMNAADFAAEFEILNGFVDDILRRAEPDMLALLATFTDKQTEELQKKLLHKNNEMIEEYRETRNGKSYREREETARTNLQRFIGRLNRPERVILRNWTRDLENIGEGRYASRVLWQSAFSQALEYRKNPSQFQQRMQPLLYNPKQFRTEQYSQQLLKNQQMTFAMLASVHQSLDSQQKKRLDLSLDSWIDTFTSLAAAR
jgi:hypothetical protein